MNYREGTSKLRDLRKQISAVREEMTKVQSAIEPQRVDDYVFKTSRGEVRLSSLFGTKNELFVVHNMGRSCLYCTMWADGFNGVYPHLADRAAFALSSPDAPDEQRAFAEERGWRFPMVSHAGSTFAKDMGYLDQKGRCVPGLSAFRREGGVVLRMSDVALHPHDDFCLVWHVFGLLPGGAGEWSPKFHYA
ncbi:MAG: DUF899 family protein [Alphaproteobacteria bacterium]